jgi:hypothetical protein
MCCVVDIQDGCEEILAEYESRAVNNGFMYHDNDGKAIVDKINAKLNRSGKKFVDTVFTPTRKSLNRRPVDEAEQVGSAVSIQNG